MENTKPKLYVFGDSFAQWPKPENCKKWWNWLEEDYDVKNYAIPGTDNSYIVFQLELLQRYKEGDRIIFVLSERSRIPKWFYHNLYEEFLKFRWAGLFARGIFKSFFNLLGVRKSDNEHYIWALQNLRLIQDSILSDPSFEEEENARYRRRKSDNPVMIYDFYRNLKNNILVDFKPIFFTWCPRTYEMGEDFINYIPWESYEHIKIEGDNQDQHPSKKGHITWYKVIKSKLIE